MKAFLGFALLLLGLVCPLSALTKNLVLDYGAIPNDGNYDDWALQRALDDFKTASEKFSIFIPNGTYNFNTTIMKPAGVATPNIIGEDVNYTILHWDFAPRVRSANPQEYGEADQGRLGRAAMHFRGQSGDLALAELANLTLIGNGHGVAVQVADLDGFTIRNCKFMNFDTGGEFLNCTGYTEFVVFDSCLFDYSLSRALSYRRLGATGGTESFHGSGMRNSFIRDGGSTRFWEFVTIGNNCLVYNAPLSASMWVRDLTGSLLGGYRGRVIVRNNSTYPASFYGTLCLEVGGRAYLGVSNPGPIHMVGSYLVLAGAVVYPNHMQFSSSY